jgi:hypothetical protein
MAGDRRICDGVGDADVCGPSVNFGGPWCPHTEHCDGATTDGHVHIIIGGSGTYRIEFGADGEVVRDDRPWQMRT